MISSEADDTKRILADVDADRGNNRLILLDMAVLLSLVAPSKHHSLEGREHGRTIPLNYGAVAKINKGSTSGNYPVEKAR